MLFASILTALLLITQSTATAGELTLRKDASNKLAKIVCSKKPLDSTNAELAGIYDAQIEGQLLIPNRSGKAELKDAARKARSLARINNYHGYAFGVCPSGIGFSVALPSPSPLHSKGQLPMAALKKHCRNWRADFAPATAAAPVRINVKSGSLRLPRASGTMSITCQPKSPSWQGPIQWYSVPLGTGAAGIPSSSLVKKPSDDRRNSLYEWINAARKSAGIAPLIVNKPLESTADSLAIGGRLSHDRKMLRSSAADLKPNGVHLIGENRVKGNTTEEMARLLWNSPRHRSLLLNSNATYVGIKLVTARNGFLAVLVFGESSLTFARRGKKK